MIETPGQFAVRAAARATGRVEARTPGTWVMTLALAGCASAGCSTQGGGIERHGVTDSPPLCTVAVAPALNFSGSREFDPVKVADLMASELTSLPGVGVIGVNRVLAILAEQGVDRIRSPQHALDICDRLGADAIVVFAITEYDAYTPVVGLAAQLYGKRPSPSAALDPVATTQMARPLPVVSGDEASRPRAQLQVVFNAAHEDVQDDVRRYAESRDAQDSPYGYGKYLVSQELYLRYCCYTVAHALWQQQSVMSVFVEAAPSEAQESGS